MPATTTITILKRTKKHVTVSVAGAAGIEQRKFSHEEWADYQRSLVPSWGSHRPAVEFVFPEGTE